MKALTVNFDSQADKTTITRHKEFMESGWVTQMDIMRDVITQLTHQYDEMLSKQYLEVVK
jgi:hypothetical protein